MENIVEFKNVGKFFGKNIALNKLFLKVIEDEFVALVGNNGSGKSTTIHILCNLINYDEGEVFAFGKKVAPEYISYKNKFGIVLSKPYYIDEFTPEEYLKFVCKFQFVPKDQISQRINDITDLLNLGDNLKKPIKDLSSGNQMKVSLASSLIHNPEVLILDEPFVNLDIGTIEIFMSLLKSFRGKKTIFITSHSLDLVADLCDRFLIIDDGSIVMEINKIDHQSIESIKAAVKEKLSGKKEIQTLDWLK